MRIYEDEFGKDTHYNIKVKRGSVRTRSKECNEYKPEVKILTVDLDSKYCEVLIWDDDIIPIITLESGEKGIYLSKLTYNTTITLSEFEGWKIFDAYVRRYTLYVIIHKN